MKNIIVLTVIAVSSVMGLAQNQRLKPTDMLEWKSISQYAISNNGNWVVYAQAPYVGDGELYVKHTDSNTKRMFPRGYKAQISAQSNYVVFMIKPHLDSLRKCKLDKVPKKKWPTDTMAVYVMEEDTLMKFPGVKSFKTSAEGQNWLAFQYTKPQKKKPVQSESKKKKKKKKKNTSAESPKSKKKPIKRKTSDVVVFDPISQEKYQFADAEQYVLSKYGNAIGVVQAFGDTIDSTNVIWFDAATQKIDTAYSGLGKSTQMAFSYDGNQLAWLTTADTGKAKAYALFYTQGNKGTRIIVDTNDRYIIDGHTVSKNGRVYFSENGEKIFFGTADRPKEAPKDSLPADEKAQVDVWSYTDLRPQPMQLLRKKRDENKTYLHVFNIATQKAVSLANDSTDYVYGLMNGNADVALLSETKNYQLSNSWKYPFGRDYYLLDTKTGNKKLLKKDIGYNTSISPSGKYFAYYSSENQNWWVKNVASGAEVNVTEALSGIGQIWYNEQSQIPAAPFAFGTSGWTTNEEWLIVNAKYDVWLVDPTGQNKAVSLTNGQADVNKERLRLMNFDYDLDYVRIDSVMLFKGQNLEDNRNGFLLRYPNAERMVNMGWRQESYTGVKRAKHVNRFVFRPGNYRQYPDVALSQQPFKNMIDGVFDEYTVVSDANPQMKKYAWGDVYKHYWTDEHGEPQRGLLYVPEGVEKNGTAPAIIYFYEKYFTSEYSYKSFAPSRSVISVPLYVSNGYVVLIPDINYGVGHPGKDATKTVEGAAQSLIDEGWVDAKHIGIQGQSWGGYQVAQIITQSNMFAAGMAGAPVSNMTSAYGGIRWGSGMSRAFQYETTQSRIGADLWSAPDLYIENSPLFHLPNVTTPVLIMHNDADGAVPYYQGIEMFMGLRRLEKPSWLLVYNNEQHNLTKMPNRIDLTNRMFQFFNHYLKESPAPSWMVEGVPAINKGKDYGFEMVK